MSRRSFDIVLSELAQHDLTDILQYTLETWGADQMDAYAAKLESGIQLLQENPTLGKTREDLFEGCRTPRVEHHLVLYEIGDSEIRVARILHARMDAPSQFAD
ncbi:type II toxin-antitoxin system RelE/ParE family toxin [Paraburkholderia sediminicola]|uniref:type II toxin-antitoxin system RelE/ParE family toxin n=1 Tax=Paraburkholderia sediminicola TaxID=458836 RepID=UPI0038B88E04